jgi:thioredoxin reductase (NADPH)
MTATPYTRRVRHEVVIAGGGPAGVSCALECFDMALDVLLLEAHAALGGQLGETPNPIRNLPAGVFPDGETLRRALEQAAAILGGRRRTGAAVLRADLAARRIEAEGLGAVEYRALVIATGRRRRRLPFAEEGAFGGDVTYQIELPPPGRFRGRDVAVVGGGDSAALDALELARQGSRVFLLHRRPLHARRDIGEAVRAARAIETMEGFEVDALEGTERLEAVVAVRPATGERRRLAAGGLVLKLGFVPNTDLFRGQIELDAEGAVVVDAAARTSREGVFAAGDVAAGSYLRVGAAMGQGMLAARAVLGYLEGRHDR